MINNKQQNLVTVNDLPEDAICDDAIYASYFNLKLKKSEDDIKNGRVMTIEESKERMRAKYEGFNI